jgi:hypothetical protein
VSNFATEIYRLFDPAYSASGDLSQISHQRRPEDVLIMMFEILSKEVEGRKGGKKGGREGERG